MRDREIIAVFHYDDHPLGSHRCGAEPYRYAEEVIRCKDCRHSDTVTYPSGITEMTCPIMFETDCDDPFCGTWLIVDPNDFCSYGEVRDE